MRDRMNEEVREDDEKKNNNGWMGLMGKGTNRSKSGKRGQEHGGLVVALLPCRLRLPDCRARAVDVLTKATHLRLQPPINPPSSRDKPPVILLDPKSLLLDYALDLLISRPPIVIALLSASYTFTRRQITTPSVHAIHPARDTPSDNLLNNISLGRPGSPRTFLEGSLVCSKRIRA